MFERLGETVRENEATFGVGVLHFHRTTRVGRDDVSRLQGRSRGKVLASGRDGDEIDGESQVRNGLHRRKHGSGARHVVNHVAHLGGGFERNAACIEGDPLAHENDGGIVNLAAVIAKFDHCGRYGTSLSNTKESSHAECFKCGLLKKRCGDLFSILNDFAGLFTEKCRRAEVSGRVGQSAHLDDGRADRCAFGEGFRIVRVGEPQHLRARQSLRILLVVHLGRERANDVLREQTGAGLTVFTEPVGGFKEKRGNLAKLRNSCTNPSTHAFRCVFGSGAKMQQYDAIGPVAAGRYRQHLSLLSGKEARVSQRLK